MNPHEQEQSPSFELPPARPPEQDAEALPEQQGVDRTEKQANIAVEQGVPSQAPPMPPPQPLQQGNGGQATADPYAPPTQANTPQIADDTDLIEKEWVIKAKEIVARTAHDPHLQNKEINKFKADYLKKRYNKEVKLSED